MVDRGWWLAWEFHVIDNDFCGVTEGTTKRFSDPELSV
jgi:hypothetical protein